MAHRLVSTGGEEPVRGAGHVKVMAEDEWAHIVLIAALSFTDDTALLKKALVPELLVRSMLALPCKPLSTLVCCADILLIGSPQTILFALEVI